MNISIEEQLFGKKNNLLKVKSIGMFFRNNNL